MLTPPVDLPEAVLAAALDRHWGVAVASMAYQPVGFGSHHWRATDGAGTRWFVTADELAVKRHSRREPLDAAYHRLRAALAAATDLRRHGRTFVLAPVPTGGGEPVARADRRYAVALYPFVDGQSFRWGEFATPAHRDAVLHLVLGVHTAPPGACRRAMTDDFAVPHRDELEAALDPAGKIADCGPYAHAVAALLREHAAAVRRLLLRYDTLVAAGRADAGPRVLTHGEPHPGNTMLARDGWLLIDWDTVLLAPPERDLWSLEAGDGSVLSRYAEATGVRPRPSMLDLYRIRWDLADLAVEVRRFRNPHRASAEDEASWQLLRSLLEAVSR